MSLFHRQTTRYSAFSNKTYHYFGNEVRSMLGVDGGAHAALQTLAPDWAEELGDGEFYPNVSCTGADVHDTGTGNGKDLSSTIVLNSGFYTQRSGTTRQTFVLSEGPVIVVDTVAVDADGDNYTGGV